ncbi:MULTISPECIES: DUF1992 domain-containing protein [Actinopolyspora]|uniref:DnaJ homologue subfamily C member 28 conserved domain-containing protein n=1 Tax=Actinopolyspora saharensis TaxID=995062 RepID=A0A1H0ZX26_9ACTN|nr:MULTISPECIES: DUF1992 domain-containing protein [Actinopolyspora]NHD15549.1 DUF1992 domain-containing protein [Actinopolyspora sp. BKK2]NHE75237.1 DUF1992 domain-containing protein [Actinopolyspora sp. BKK1]SDQ31616.1 protein of unknown function [Actinopolyspora saharensis]
MTERKPPGMSFESWIDRQVRVARERGDFDDLPGMGKPLPDPSPDDELAWVKKYVEREGLSTESLLPPAVQLRKEIDRLPERVAEQRSEQAVRELVDELNIRVVEWLRAPSGPKIKVGPVDVEQVVRQWRQQRAADSEWSGEGAAAGEPARIPEGPAGRTRVRDRLRSWWHGTVRGRGAR